MVTIKGIYHIKVSHMHARVRRARARASLIFYFTKVYCHNLHKRVIKGQIYNKHAQYTVAQYLRLNVIKNKLSVVNPGFKSWVGENS